jgi:hypothetical protein
MSKAIELALLALQAFQVLFLWLHDWIPLGRFNDVRAVRAADTPSRLLVVTFVQSIPFSIGLFFSAMYFGRPYPPWLLNWLWISYALLFLGQLRAWWIPYLIKSEPARAARYQKMFGNTYSFLPARNGLVPNTAHVALHLATAATLLILFLARNS